MQEKADPVRDKARRPAALDVAPVVTPFIVMEVGWLRPSYPMWRRQPETMPPFASYVYAQPPAVRTA
jgi:hypothetical protein